MKYAIKMIKTLTRTVIVDDESYVEAKHKAINEYTMGRLDLTDDNSSSEIECFDDTKNYIEIFGKENFEKMEVSKEFE